VGAAARVKPRFLSVCSRGRPNTKGNRKGNEVQRLESHMLNVTKIIVLARVGAVNSEELVLVVIHRSVLDFCPNKY
jgi:hypothetical protein